MKKSFLLILLLGLCFYLKAQTIEAVDKKGTIVGLESSKWTLSGFDIFNKNTGNVGIGTNNPLQKLEVAGSIYLNAENSAIVADFTPRSRLGFVKKSGSGPFIGAGNNVPIIFSQLSNFGQTDILPNINNTFTERMRIDGSGNVGIGGAIPQNILHLSGITNFPAGNLLRYMQLTNFNTGNTNSDGTIIGINAVGTTEINNRESQPIVFSTTNAERMRIDASGNVGIGIAIPTSPLHVQGNAHVTGGFLDSSGDIGTSGQVLSSTGSLTDWVASTSLGWGLLGNSATNPATNYIGTSDNQDFVFRSNNVEKMRLFSLLTNPYIGIGRNSIAGVNGGASSYTGPTLFFGNLGNISSATGLDFIIDDDNNAINTRFTFKTNGDGAAGTIELMEIGENGNVGIGLPSGTATATLHTYGTLRFENLGTNTINTNILTTDANGNATTRDLGNLLNGNALTSLNGLTPSVQTFGIGTTGTDFNISSVGAVHTFNFPDASSTNRGLLTSADWTIFNNKIGVVTATTPAAVTTAGTTATINNTTANWNANQLQGSNISATAPNDGEVLKWDANTSAWTPKNSRIYLKQISNLTSSTTLAADISDITITLISGKNYNCDCKILYSTNTNGNNVGFSVLFPAGINSLQLRVPSGNNNTTNPFLQFAIITSGTTYQPTVIQNTLTNIVLFSELKGVLSPSANGTFQLRFHSENTGPTITIYSGSFCILEEY